MVYEDPFFEEFEFPPEEEEDQESNTLWWRRPLLIGVAAITAAAMLLVPLYNIINPDRPVSDSGLEVCGFDYCIVQDAAIDAGLNEEMSRLANTFLGDEQARDFARTLLERLSERNVSFIIVDQLGATLKGQYDAADRTIRVERPVRAWIVVHEVAHTRASGHGEEFQRVLIELTRWIEEEHLLTR